LMLRVRLSSRVSRKISLTSRFEINKWQTTPQGVGEAVGAL